MISNESTFEGVLRAGNDYDERIRELLADGEDSPETIASMLPCEPPRTPAI